MWVCIVPKQVGGANYKPVFMGENKWQNMDQIWKGKNDYSGQWHYNQPVWKFKYDHK